KTSNPLPLRQGGGQGRGCSPFTLPPSLADATMADLKITALHKYYGTLHAVKGVDLEIPAGEFTVLVGQSGCGKSTLLRTIAGLEDADQGNIEIGGQVMNHVLPRDRDIAMV